MPSNIKGEDCRISIHTVRENNRTTLFLEDNGIGIQDSEIGRIFDKGFTGTNGRHNRQSTGIGLYLCRKLCCKLGISIEAQSIEGNIQGSCCIFLTAAAIFPDTDKMKNCKSIFQNCKVTAN
ncbi:MAG: ATP-binding protein [Blautia marasmi]